MQAFLAALVGGLTIAGGLAAVLVTGRSTRSQWRNDTQLKVGTEVLSALQKRVSSINDLAYLADKNSDDGEKAWLVECAAVMEWNNARHAALLVSPPDIAALLHTGRTYSQGTLEQCRIRYRRAGSPAAAGPAQPVLLLPAFVLAGLGIGCGETAQSAAVAALAPGQLRGSAFGLLATVQAGGNLIASAVAGLLWSAVSPLAAFVFLAAAMIIVAAPIITAGPGSAGRAGDMRRKARPFPG